MKNASKNRYPFLSRADIKRRIESDDEYALECAVALERRTRERQAGHGTGACPSGWMSSHRIVAARLVAQFEADKLTPQERRTLVGIVARYARQLARLERERALREHPELAAVASLFGVAPKPEPDADAVSTEPTGSEAGLPPRVLQVVQGAPGCHVAGIAKALDRATAEISPVVRDLVATKRLRKRGDGRWATYTVR
jgi:hypothetical protein